MSKSAKSREFFHSASALAVGGFLTDPTRDNVSSQAATSLSPLGGYGSTEASEFKYKEILSFKLGTTEVIGNYDVETDTHSNLSTCIIKDLNVLGVVTADKVVARLATSHSGSAQHPSFNIVGSHFVNLRIAGKLVGADLKKEVEDEERCRGHLGRELLKDPNNPKDPPLRSSLFAADEHHGRHIPGFGRVFIGEFYPGYRRTGRLAMLRFELGCAVQGEIAFAVVEGGGGKWPNQ